MTGPRPSAWIAIGAGAAVVAVAAFVAAEPALATLARVGLAVLVLAWGRVVYGAPAALAAATLAAFSLPVTGESEVPAWALLAAAQLLTAFVLMRCLLDPTMQWIGAAAAALATALLAGAAVVEEASTGRWLLLFSALAAVSRIVTAERGEPRVRVARATLASVLLVWLGAAVLLAVVSPFVNLPSPSEYVGGRGFAVMPVAAAASAAQQLPLRSAGVPLLLAVLRPWRRQRRYADTVGAAALACLALPTWQAAGAAGHGLAGLAGVIAALALIDGACWDIDARWRRQAATAALALQVAIMIVFPVRRGAHERMPTAQRDQVLAAGPPPSERR